MIDPALERSGVGHVAHAIAMAHAIYKIDWPNFEFDPLNKGSNKGSAKVLFKTSFCN